MPRKSPTLEIYEMPGDKFADLTAAQTHSLAETATDLLATIRAMLESGALVNQNGKIIPANMQG
jgi:hypothetical protein